MNLVRDDWVIGLWKAVYMWSDGSECNRAIVYSSEVNSVMK